MFNLDISAQATAGSLAFESVSIAKCTVKDFGRGERPSSVPVTFRDCNIGTLTLSAGANVTLERTQVGNLRIESVRYLKMEGGCILNLECPMPEKENPFLGSVSFKNASIPRKRDPDFLTGAQPLRNVRHHLERIENAQTANLFHSGVLAVEREDDPRVSRFVSLCYGTFSDFGSSIGRSLAWWGLLGVATWLLIYSVNGATMGMRDPDSYSGWRQVLIEKHCRCDGQAGRALYLTIQSMINPLGFFSTRKLIVAAEPWLAPVLGIVGILSAVLIALTILAIRRRFKMQ